MRSRSVSTGLLRFSDVLSTPEAPTDATGMSAC